MSTKKLRCAIYTRKSTDEGLDQTFNSLDAQREACGAYILSQAGEGWSAAKDIYDDGGYSGGSMDRPALTRLLAEIEAGRIDVIVVYKVDRLTRSLADFARIVEILDRTGASFVSVTQAFNTTTSMGRLTLNVLLSFAQFEREVTGERIRDKIAASKAKGMWMGGHPPLGYDIRNRALHVNVAEALIVQDIYRRYLSERSVIDLRDALDRDCIRSKVWTTTAGRVVGGNAFTHGALYHILSSRLYIGEIVHRDRVHQGQHQAIIEPALFEAVQAKLKLGAPPMPGTNARGYALPLLGRIFDDRGNPMTSGHGNKGVRRYHYYVSTGLTRRKNPGTLPRVSAPMLHAEITKLVGPVLANGWLSNAPQEKRVFEAIARITLSSDRIVAELRVEAIDAGRSASLEASVDLERKAHTRRLLAADGQDKTPSIDQALVRAIVNARRWTADLANGEAGSIEALAARERLCVTHLGKLLPLAYLAPDLVEMILDGRQPPRLNLTALTVSPLPLARAEQRAFVAQFR